MCKIGKINNFSCVCMYRLLENSDDTRELHSHKSKAVLEYIECIHISDFQNMLSSCFTFLGYNSWSWFGRGYRGDASCLT